MKIITDKDIALYPRSDLGGLYMHSMNDLPHVCLREQPAGLNHAKTQLHKLSPWPTQECC